MSRKHPFTLHLGAPPLQHVSDMKTGDIGILAHHESESIDGILVIRSWAGLHGINDDRFWGVARGVAKTDNMQHSPGYDTAKFFKVRILQPGESFTVTIKGDK